MSETALSLNEAEALSRKAARGGGLSWGLAEEAGRAVVWLEARGMGGCAALARLLEEGSGDKAIGRMPKIVNGVWIPVSKTLCPVSAGSAFSDHAGILPLAGFAVGKLREALLFLPFVAMVARDHGHVLALNWRGGTLKTDGIDVEAGPLPSGTLENLRISVDTHLGKPRDCRTRAICRPDALETLNRFAHRTYAPATDASRTSGAGAGLTDND